MLDIIGLFHLNIELGSCQVLHVLIVDVGDEGSDVLDCLVMEDCLPAVLLGQLISFSIVLGLEFRLHFLSAVLELVLDFQNVLV